MVQDTIHASITAENDPPIISKEMIEEIWNLIINSEYKRFQSPLGTKVSSMSLDNDRRFPIINKFKL